MLRYYAARFGTVEINHTFYRMPTERALATWGAQVPPGFRFALKLHQRLSHVQMLREGEAALHRFLDAAHRLAAAGQLGPLLLQLPPSLRADLPRLDAFLALVPPPFRLALEVRHPSWHGEDTYALLRRHRVALCLAETDDAATPLVVTTDFVYVRLRREGYDAETLGVWRERLTGWVSAGLDVFAYVKHDEAGRAPACAEALLGG